MGIFFTGCENNPDESTPQGEKIINNLLLNPTSETVIEATNKFGFKIFKEIHDDAKADENLFISPTSISLALSMTYNGAVGETKDSIALVLQMSGIDPDELNQINKDLIAGLTTMDNMVELSIANSIWYRQDVPVKTEFKNTNQEYYDAEIEALDFSDPATKDIINSWVEEKTNDKIKDLVSRVEPYHVMFLINAIYFNGTWKKEFNKENTYTASFHVNNQKDVNVDMMQLEDTVNYAQTDLYNAIELDYGNGNYSMVVLLPGEQYAADEIIDNLTPESWNNLMDDMHKEKVDVHMPKFKFEYEKELNDVLIRMGMGIAFGLGPVDFSGIADGYDLAIDYVKHKSFVDVNEEGTEAAAATVVVIFESASPDEIIFNANKPFVFAIREKNTGALVFIGKVSDPSLD